MENKEKILDFVNNTKEFTDENLKYTDEISDILKELEGENIYNTIERREKKINLEKISKENFSTLEIITPKDKIETIEAEEKSKRQKKKLEKVEEEKISINKNHLSSKDAFELIIKNYNDILFKSEIVNYGIEFLTEKLELGDFTYINKILFETNEINENIKSDLIKKILLNNNYLLYDYYLKIIFKDIDLENFNYSKDIINLCGINPNLKPKDIRKYYGKNLRLFLETKSSEEIEKFYNITEENFKSLENNYFILDLYRNFIVPSLKRIIKKYDIKSMEDLEEIVFLIEKYPELKYDKESRVVFVSYEILTKKKIAMSYDRDIIFEVQNCIEKILYNTKKIDYNLIHFCSFFDGKLDINKNINMLMNILEDTNTISLSKTKYQKAKEETILEILNYIQWLLGHHPKQTRTIEFDKFMEEFIIYNWNIFSKENTSYNNFKFKLRDYKKLDLIIEKSQNLTIRKFNNWYLENGDFVISTLVTLVLFISSCYFGVKIILSMLSKVDNKFILVFIIILEIIVVGILINFILSKPKKIKNKK